MARRECLGPPHLATAAVRESLERSTDRNRVLGDWSYRITVWAPVPHPISRTTVTGRIKRIHMQHIRQCAGLVRQADGFLGPSIREHTTSQAVSFIVLKSPQKGNPLSA